ncbi:MAG: hypothetical protein ACIALR_12145 [Blastopirellula sp. JB062]
MKWHYTNGRRIDAIFASEALLPAASGSANRMGPAVWLSANAQWEATANRAVRRTDGTIMRCDRERTDIFCDGLFRFEINPAHRLIAWREFAEMRRIERSDLLRIEALARRLGSEPNLWYASLQPIGSDQWSTVERWNRHFWEPVETVCAAAAWPSFDSRRAG